MTIIDQAKQAMLNLHNLTIGFRSGSPPDPHSVLGYQSEIMWLYAQLGEEMAKTFGSKERAYLTRKIEQARLHAHGRVEMKLTSKDAEEAAFRAVKEQYDAEIDAMQEFELLRVMLKSLQNALDHTRTVVSFIKTTEKNDS